MKLFCIWASGSVLFKRFLIWSSGGPPVRWIGTIMQFCNRASYGLFEIWQVQEEMLLKEKVYARRSDDAQRPITIAHLEPSFGSGELKASFWGYI